MENGLADANELQVRSDVQTEAVDLELSDVKARMSARKARRSWD